MSPSILLAPLSPALRKTENLGLLPLLEFRSPLHRRKEGPVRDTCVVTVPLLGSGKTSLINHNCLGWTSEFSAAINYKKLTKWKT